MFHKLGEKKIKNIKSPEADRFFVVLNQSSTKLRKYANELADFLLTIEKKPSSMLSLITSLRALTTMSVNTLDEGINKIKLDYIDLNKEISSSNTLPFDSNTLTILIEKQEQLNKEAQQVLSEAVKLYQLKMK